MKAILYKKYGPLDDLVLKDVEKPIPKDNEVLVKVYAASVNFNNLVFVKGEPFLARLETGLLKPKFKIPGNDISGRVEAVGIDVKQFQQGDEVFGDTSECGFGAFGEYVSVTENALALKPTNISFEEAAVVPEAALVALQALRDRGQIHNGKKVLICGASGGIGTFAVQIAKYFGTEVSGVCSTNNLELVRSIGADHVIDYTQEDFIKNRQRYDLILATAGYRSMFDYRRALSPKGICVVTGGNMSQIFHAMLLGPWISMVGSKKLGSMLVTPNKDLSFVKELLEAGKVKPVIDRRYSLSEVPEALRYYEKGHAKGKVVIYVEHGNKT
ncbi:MAG: NAD(P)-dependent alcohol dehydrogenase [Deltaproteobacteria bacterium]|nr:NAD(P)-dependent alcohol dehydrogenase [Deltaproteobacteria bacterium]